MLFFFEISNLYKMCQMLPNFGGLVLGSIEVDFANRFCFDFLKSFLMVNRTDLFAQNRVETAENEPSIIPHITLSILANLQREKCQILPSFANEKIAKLHIQESIRCHQGSRGGDGQSRRIATASGRADIRQGLEELADQEGHGVERDGRALGLLEEFLRVTVRPRARREQHVDIAV